jgi:hypothetical protein
MAKFVRHYPVECKFIATRYLVSEFLTAMLAKAVMMLLEALLMRLIQSFVTSGFRIGFPQAA